MTLSQRRRLQLAATAFLPLPLIPFNNAPARKGNLDLCAIFVWSNKPVLLFVSRVVFFNLYSIKWKVFSSTMAGISSLAVRGIRSFGPDNVDEQRITFEKPLTLILGQNGCGKTTIIECLRYAITGQFPPGSRNECFVHDAKVNRSTEVKGQVRLKVRITSSSFCVLSCRSLMYSPHLLDIVCLIHYLLLVCSLVGFNHHIVQFWVAFAPLFHIHILFPTPFKKLTHVNLIQVMNCIWDNWNYINNIGTYTHISNFNDTMFKEKCFGHYYN